MNTKTICLLALMAGAVGVLAQTNSPSAAEEPANDWKPATSNQQGKQYPQVNSEGRVRARVMASGAQSVQLDLGGVKYPLAKGDDGAWIGFSKPQDEGFHYYQIVVDGAQVPDPNSLYYYGASRWGSGVEVPAKDADFYALKNVPHGQLRGRFIFPRAPMPSYAALFTRRRITKRIPRRAIRFCISNTAAVRTKRAGAGKATRVSSWIT